MGRLFLTILEKRLAETGKVVLYFFPVLAVLTQINETFGSFALLSTVQFPAFLQFTTVVNCVTISK